MLLSKIHAGTEDKRYLSIKGRCKVYELFKIHLNPVKARSNALKDYYLRVLKEYIKKKKKIPALFPLLHLLQKLG